MPDDRESPDSEGDGNTPSVEWTAFHSFQQRLQQGDSRAARQLFDTYSQRLIRLAGKNIHPALLKRFDGEDVVQSAFRTFFRRQEKGDFQIDHSQQLWQLLATITLCKTRSHARRHTAQRRNVRADEVILADLELLKQKPSPEDAIALWEEIEAALQGLPDQAMEILASRLEDKNKSEIAKEMNLSRQTIHRTLKLVEERLIVRFGLYSGEASTNLEKDKDSM